MDISIKCQLSLSKKLRALLSDGETRLTLVSPNIIDGRGEAKIIISSDKNINKNIPDLFGKETSIILTPIEIEDVTINNNSVGSIFSKKITKLDNPSPLSRLATISEPGEDPDEIAHAIKNEEQIREEMTGLKQEVNIMKKASYKKYVNDMNALEEAIESSKNKDSGINPDLIQNKFKRAEAIEQKEKAESIDVDAYIINDKCASLSIDDLGINLTLNIPFNLANISAKRLFNSKQLSFLLKQKLIRFITPEEVPLYRKKAEESIMKASMTYDVFSSTEEAERHMENKGMNVEQVELGDNSNFDSPTESEILMTNLTSGPSTIRRGTVKTVHGNSSNRLQSIPEQKNINGIKTIKRSGLSY